MARAGLDRAARAAAFLRQRNDPQGVPLIVVAEALGHSGTRMAEKHYAHLAPSFVADTIRRTAPDVSLPGEGIMRLEARV